MTAKGGGHHGANPTNNSSAGKSCSFETDGKRFTDESDSTNDMNSCYIAAKKPVLDSVSVRWFWDGFEHVDPSKEANAQEKRLTNYTTTLANEYAKLGKDWEEELRQLARERTLMKELDLLNEPKIEPSLGKTEEDEDHE